jgi:hypothetical protein
MRPKISTLAKVAHPKLRGGFKLIMDGSVAQLVERTTENREVTGSTPVGATNGESRCEGSMQHPLDFNRSAGSVEGSR